MDRDELLKLLEGQTRKEALEAIWHHFQVAPEWFWGELISMLPKSNERVQIAICWLLRRKMSLEKSGHLANQLLQVPLDTVPAMPKVDLCQALIESSMEDIQKEALEHFLDNHLEAENVFLMAWTLSLLCKAAAYHNEWIEKAQMLVRTHESHPKASVRARVRNLKKQFTFLK